MCIMLNDVLGEQRTLLQLFTIRRPPRSRITDRHRINRLAPGSARNLSKRLANGVAL